jgi:hypothetical protein
VTGKGVSFSAHQGDPKALHSISNASQAIGKNRLVDKVVVLHLAVDVAVRILASGAELLAEENIGKPRRTQMFLQRLSIELWITLAVRD